ncbi:YdeI/OmpD-associated family protein [Candidatus Woesearchaeota archaeon]|nr:YdeI/OmpD-associated family protein [Candidatus Woesearchaeota archaeon]
MNKMNPTPAKEKSEPIVPTDLRKVLDPVSMAKWKSLTPIARRDFISWIDSVKQPETRKRRIESIPSRLASGKRRPCCFAVVPMPLYKALGANAKAKATWSDLDSNKRRNFIDWIESAKESDERKKRIEKTCAMLAAGKRHT